MADHQNRFFHRKKIMTIFFVCAAVLCGLLGRLLYLMVWRAEYYEEAATRLHERERSIKAARGRILDRNGVVLADNKMVCTVSVIHNQIEEPEQVIAILVKELGISEEEARKRVEKYSSIERVKSNVDKTVGDRIREYDLAGVKVDEDYKRYYPYGDLASKVLGFTGGDNQGIIGLEVKYDKYLNDPDDHGRQGDRGGYGRGASGGTGAGHGSSYQHRPEHPGVCYTAGGAGLCYQGGGQCLYSGYESAERRDPGYGELSGV